MSVSIRVLMVEDSILDAELELAELRHGGYEPICQRVDTAEAMQEALKRGSWEIIISDYVMPCFTGPEALKLVQRMGIDLPFIMVTGQAGEATAIETLTTGAHDYVMKGNLARLVPAVQRVLQDAVLRRERREAGEALRKANEELRLAHAELEKRVEERTAELASERQRLAITLRSIGDGVIAADDQGKVILMNRVAEELTGWAEEEAVGRPLAEVFRIINEQSRAVCGNPVEKVLKMGLIVGLANHTVLVCRDGTERTIADSAAPIRGDNGEITGVVLVFRDVTEHKRAEQEREQLLRQVRFEEVRWRTLVESMPDLVTECDARGHATYINAAQSRLFGYHVDPNVDLDAHPVYYKICHPDGTLFAAEDLPLQCAALRGEESRDVEVLLRTPEGEELVTMWDAAPLHNMEGQVIGAVAVGHDVTEQRRAGQALRESEERFRTLVMASSDVVYRMSPDWSEMRQLRGGEFLADAETPTRTRLQEYIHPDDRAHVMAVIKEAIRTKSTFELEHRVLRVDGSLGWTLSRAIPLKDANGEIVEWIGTATDITERRRAEAEREQLLNEVEERRNLFQMVVENAPSGIAVLRGYDLVYEVVNPAYQLFAPGKQMMGRTFAEVWPEVAEEQMPLLRGVLDTGEPFHAADLLIPIRRSPGAPLEDRYWNYSYLRLPPDRSGQPGILSWVVETTENVRARQRVEDLAKEVHGRAAEMQAANDEGISAGRE